MKALKWSPGDVAVEVHAVVEGVHEAVGRAQRGERVLGQVSSVHQLHHGPGVPTHILLEGPADGGPPSQQPQDYRATETEPLY